MQQAVTEKGVRNDSVRRSVQCEVRALPISEKEGATRNGRKETHKSNGRRVAVLGTLSVPSIYPNSPAEILLMKTGQNGVLYNVSCS
jgi:hypothetical protein